MLRDIMIGRSTIKSCEKGMDFLSVLKLRFFFSTVAQCVREKGEEERVTDLEKQGFSYLDARCHLG